ncbi:MAG: hypothetical protein ACRDXX_09600 [Stackebrandtia sp.]
MAYSQSPFGTPPPAPEVFDPPVGVSPSYERRRARIEPEYGDSIRSTNSPVGVRTTYTPRRQPAVPPPRDGRRRPSPVNADNFETIPLQRAARRARQKKQSWLIALASLVGVVTVAACGAGVWSLLREDPGETVAPTPIEDSDVAEEAEPAEDLLATRDVDSEPLTAEELFSDDVLAPEGADVYPVLGTDSLDDCGEAAVDGVVELLADVDCTQVVRATVSSPQETYVATVGAVNLADAETAEALRADLESGVEGGFAALRAGGDSQTLGLNPTVLGFNAFGHYLLYTVIGRADGEAPSGDDEAVSAMVTDLVDVYLIDQITASRAD